MKILLNCTFFASILFSTSALPNSWKLSWEIKGLANPESVVYDSSRNIIFISNQNYSGKDGEASIGKLSVEGEIIKKEWIKGLNEQRYCR